MTDVANARRAIVDVCRRLYQRGLIAGSDGNVSVRLNDQCVLVTPSGLSKVDVTVDDLVEVAMDGTHLRGTHRASSEIAMHLQLYKTRMDIGAVVHAHPPTATAFSVANEPIVSNVLPELLVQVGAVVAVPYATPGTPALSAALEPYLASHNAFLLANHGATTVGPSLRVAHQRMESLEHGARILLMARLLGRVNTLSASQVEALVHAPSQLTTSENGGGTSDGAGSRSKES